MNIEEETYEEATIRAEYTYEWLKDKVHEQYEEIERLNNIIKEIKNAFEDKNIHNNMELVKRIEELVELKEK